MATYYKLAVWDERLQCFRDGKRGYSTPTEAFVDAKSPGRYRVSQVDGAGLRTDLEPFEVSGLSARLDKASARLSHKPSVTSLVYGRRIMR
jgi:hypothetical protein